MSWRIGFGLATATSLLAWFNLDLGSRPVDVSPIVAPARPLALPTIAAEQPELFVAEIGTAAQRPLFHRTRRPYLPPPPEPEPPVVPIAVEATPALPAPDAKLLGTRLIAGNWKALIALGEELNWYSTGDDLRGWLAKHIDGATVVLNRNDEIHELRLFPIEANRYR